MRKISVLILMSFLTALCSGQDLIVTNTGDSINCKITKIKHDRIYFTFKYKAEIRSTLLPVGDIKTYLQNYFPDSQIAEEKPKPKGKFNHFRIAVNGGLSYETAKINESPYIIEYFKELQSGFNLGSTVNYYFSEYLGIGLKFNRFFTSNKLANIGYANADGTITYGKLSDDIRVSFYGPSFSTRLINRNKKNAFILNYALGYLDYKNKMFLGIPYILHGGTFGMDLDLGYDVGISKNLSLGFQISLVSGLLTKYTIDDGHTSQLFNLEKDQYKNLNRIDFSVGLRFNK